MIISASRRTDIPAFYAEWFVRRVEEGYVYAINPYNSKQVRKVSLHPNDVDAIVFWTKDAKPLIGHLDYISSKGLNFYFQYTLNRYSSIFEPKMRPIGERLETFCELGSALGPNRVVWRYDPIILSSMTPPTYHLEQIENLAEKLHPYTQRLVISFLDMYGKVGHRIKSLEQETGIIVEKNASYDELGILASGIKSIGDKWGLRVYSCAEDLDLSLWGINAGACIDGQLIRELFGISAPKFAKDPNQRPECLCVQSVDIGIYNTCQFQCTYCYANASNSQIGANVAKHNPTSPGLVGTYEDMDNAQGYKQKERSKQLSLFE